MFKRAVHPGEVLKGELEEMGITPTEFARQIDVPPNRVSQIIAGKRSVTGDTALRFGHWFGSEPQCQLLSPPPHPPKKGLADSRQMRLRGPPGHGEPEFSIVFHNLGKRVGAKGRVETRLRRSRPVSSGIRFSGTCPGRCA